MHGYAVSYLISTAVSCHRNGVLIFTIWCGKLRGPSCPEISKLSWNCPEIYNCPEIL